MSGPQVSRLAAVYDDMTILMRRCALPTLAIAALLVPVATASAAPDRSGSVSAASTTFKWEGKIGTGFTAFTTFHDTIPCNTPALHTCDYTLLHVQSPGRLKVKVSSTDPLTPDTDLYVWVSDANGTQGKQKALSAASSPTPNEQVAFDVEEPGYYLIENDYTIVAGGSYDGEAVLEPGAPGGAGGENAAPVAKISSPKSSKASRKKFKTISGTAADDTTVAKVEVAVVQVKGKTCKSMRSNGSLSKTSCTAPRYVAARGTSKWSLRIRKTLPKGKYMVYARATDDAGSTQVTRKAVTLR
jgi:hypothetical protein